MQQSLEVNAVSASSEVGKGWLKLIGENLKYSRSLCKHCSNIGHCLNKMGKFVEAEEICYKQGGIKCGNRGTGFLDIAGSHR